MSSPGIPSNCGTLSQDRIDHALGGKLVGPAVLSATALGVVHDDPGQELNLASDTLTGERRWSALATGGIDDLFCWHCFRIR